MKRALVVVILAASCHRTDPAPIAHDVTPTPTATAAAASSAAPRDSSDQMWCLDEKGTDGVNEVIQPPLKVSARRAAQLLAASSYAKKIVPSPKAKILAQTYYCPDPKRCATAVTQEEKRATCDYMMRLYIYDPAMKALGGRAVAYVDMLDHVDAIDGVLWREDGASWTSEKL